MLGTIVHDEKTSRIEQHTIEDVLEDVVLEGRVVPHTILRIQLRNSKNGWVNNGRVDRCYL
jgi:hypothetical protein